MKPTIMHDEDGRAVAGIGEGEIEAADLAARRDAEEALEQPPLRRSAGSGRACPVCDRRKRRIEGLVLAHARPVLAALATGAPQPPQT